MMKKIIVSWVLLFFCLSLLCCSAYENELVYADEMKVSPISKDIAFSSNYGLYIRGGTAYGFSLSAKDSKSPNKYRPVKLLNGAKAVYAGEDHYFILDKNGDLYAFGSNEYGQLGDGTTGLVSQPKLVMREVKDVAAGSKFSLVVKNDFSLWSFGLNDRGQLGSGSTENQLKPVKVMDDILRVSCGVEHSLALRTDGALYGFGDNSFGQLGLSDLSPRLSPAKIMQSVEYLSAGASHSMALTFSGELYTFGSNFFGEGVMTEPGYHSKPVLIKDNVASVSAGYAGSFVLDKDFKLSYHGALGEEDMNEKYDLSRYKPFSFSASYSGLGSYSYRAAPALTQDGNMALLSVLATNPGEYSSLRLKDRLNLEGLYSELPGLPKPQRGESQVAGGPSPLKQELENLRLYLNKFYLLPRQKLIAFTFDDGPSAYTPALLEGLKSYDAKATFFVLGSSARYGSSVLKRMKDYGFEVASHSYNHSDYSRLTDSQVIEDLRATDAVIEAAIGYKPGLFRPPYGAYHSGTLGLLASEGKSCVLWNIDTMDWANRDAGYVRNYILTYASEGSIVLLHDIHKTSVEGFLSALPELINRGFRLVTVTELMAAKGRGMSPGEIIFSAR